MKQLHSVVLLLVGATLLKVTLDGAYLRYVKPGARPLLLAAGAVLVATAVASLFTKEKHHHQHHRHVDVSWLLLAPMLALLVVAPPALGSFTAARSGTALSKAPAEDLPAGDPVRLSLVDYASRAVFDHGSSLANRQVTVSGFLLGGSPGTWYLTRMVITCCAADAQPVKVGLTKATGHANDWVEVTGTFSTRTDKDEINGAIIPYLTVDAWHPIPAPAEPYE